MPQARALVPTAQVSRLQKAMQASLFEYEDDDVRYQPTLITQLNPVASSRPGWSSEKREPALELQRDSLIIHRVMATDVQTRATHVEHEFRTQPI